MPVVMSTRPVLQQFLHEERIPIVTLFADGTDCLNHAGHITERVALLVGSERDGVSLSLKEASTYRVAIPMAPQVESLNVSVATALALWERRAFTHDPCCRSQAPSVLGRL